MNLLLLLLRAFIQHSSRAVVSGFRDAARSSLNSQPVSSDHAPMVIMADLRPVIFLSTVFLPTSTPSNQARLGLFGMT